MAFRLNFYWKMYIQIYILEKTRNSVVFVSFLISSIYACTIDRRVDFKATDTRAGVGVPAIVWSRVISEAGTCSAEIQTVLKSFSLQSIFHFSFNIATLTAGKSEADRVFDKTKFDKSVFRILRQAWLNFFREEKANSSTSWLSTLNFPCSAEIFWPDPSTEGRTSCRRNKIPLSGRKKHVNYSQYVRIVEGKNWWDNLSYSQWLLKVVYNQCVHKFNFCYKFNFLSKFQFLTIYSLHSLCVSLCVSFLLVFSPLNPSTNKTTIQIVSAAWDAWCLWCINTFFSATTRLTCSTHVCYVIARLTRHLACTGWPEHANVLCVSQFYVQVIYFI